MDLNATLFGQMITFGIFVWFTMKFVWPPLETMLEERKAKIADGLAAAEKGHRTLEKTEADVKVKLKETKVECERLINLARKQAEQILEDAKLEAQKEKEDIVASGKAQVEQTLNYAKTELQDKIATLVVSGAEKIIEKSIKEDDHNAILDKISKQMVG